VTTGRSLAAPLAAAVCIFAACFSCTTRDAPEARRTVEAFLAALQAGDRAEIARLSPGMAEAADGRLEQVFAATAGLSRWSITDVSCRGDSGRARVTLTVDGQQVDMVIPLSRANGAWAVDSLVTATRRLDFVPLE
jgi:hypothetical protein